MFSIDTSGERGVYKGAELGTSQVKTSCQRVRTLRASNFRILYIICQSFPFSWISGFFLLAQHQRRCSRISGDYLDGRLQYIHGAR